jgi:hypothetical protein
MFAVADTDRLVADKVITAEQARVIEARARGAMVVLGINALLFCGILAATGGLIFWLASPAAVAVGGVVALAAGLFILFSGNTDLRMFGHAAALIGAGMLIGGASLELVDKHREIAGPVMAVAGAVIAALALALYRLPSSIHVVAGAILLMGVAMHLAGVGYVLNQGHLAGWPVSLFYLYAAGLIAIVGWGIDVRAVTALAIVPFAQALDTSTFYFHAAYVFYSPEPTLSILQMALLIAAGLWLARRTTERTARHGRVLAVMAFVVANLCALVGSLWGDVVGQTVWGPGADWYSAHVQWDEFDALLSAFKARTPVISAQVYAILWAIALVAMVLWSAHRSHRGLFNAALTFGAIHAYTQLFESFADEPLAYVIGGLAAIPLAWVMWRANAWLADRPTA